MKVAALLLDGNQIQWVNTTLQLKSPIQVILDIPDDTIIEPIYQERIAPSKKLLKILGENFKEITIEKDSYYRYLAKKYL